MNYELNNVKKNGVTALFYDKEGNTIRIKTTWGSYDAHNTKDYFYNKKNEFIRKETKLEDIPQLMIEGVAIFPVTQSMNIDKLQRYQELGFKIAFCSVSVFNYIRKELKNYM